MMINIFYGELKLRGNMENKKQEKIERKIIISKCIICNHHVEINLNQFYLHHKNSCLTYPAHKQICNVKCQDKRGNCICGCDNPAIRLDRKLLKIIGERLK